MKIQHTMDDHLAKYFSNITVSKPENAEFNSDYASETILEERSSVLGLTCTGDLDFAAAKSLNVLAPATGHHQPSPTPFENTAKRIYTKELVSNNFVSRSHIRSSSTHSVSRFDEDVKQCVIEQKKIQKLKSQENPQSDIAENSERNSSSRCAVTSAHTETFPSPGVSFDTVTIQEYCIEPGDNPGGNKGCPITVGWEPISAMTFDFDVYENVRSENRRRSTELPLVAAHRENILMKLGHTKAAINAGTKAANHVRRNRYQTIARLRSSKSQEVMEKVRGKFHNFLTCGEKKRREQKLLAPYLKGNHGSSRAFTKDCWLRGCNTDTGSIRSDRTVILDFS
eukprot:jgi/Psemu1/284633/fgenesh1_pg.59_\